MSVRFQPSVRNLSVHLYLKLTSLLTKIYLVQLCQDSLTATVNIKYTEFLNIFWLYFHQFSNSDVSWFSHAKVAWTYFTVDRKRRNSCLHFQYELCNVLRQVVFSNCMDTCGFLIISPLLLHFLPSSLLNSGQTFGFFRRLQFSDNLLSTHCNLKQNNNNISTNEQFVTSHVCALPFFKTTSLSCTYGYIIHLFLSYPRKWKSVQQKSDFCWIHSLSVVNNW